MYREVYREEECTGRNVAGDWGKKDSGTGVKRTDDWIEMRGLGWGQ